MRAIPLLLSLLILPILVTTGKAEQIIFTEIMYNAPAGKPDYLEIRNLSHAPRDMAKWRFSDGITYTFPDFSPASTQAHILKPRERVIISSSDPATTRAAYPWIPADRRVFGPWTGELSNSGEKITLKDKNGAIQATMTYNDAGRWPQTADGTGHSLLIVNENCDPDDALNWKSSPLNRTVSTVSTVIVNYGDSWKWNIPSSDPGTAWRTVGFDDTSWGSGPGLLGYEGDPMPGPGLQTTLASGNVTYLFRKTFNYSGNVANASITIDQIVDDGVVYFLNGQQLGFTRMDNGLGWNANASPQVGNAVEEVGAISVPATGLVNGSNVLCAEVHNVGPGSSDLVFGARATISESGSGSSATLRLSEAHFDAAGSVDWIELQNYGGSVQSTSGLFLSSKNDFSNKVALTGSIPANGFVSFAIPNGGFPSGSNPDLKLYLVDAFNNVLSAAKISRVVGRDSVQAIYPVTPISKPAWQLFSTQAEWYNSSTHTQNAANNPSIVSSIVINEIMCDPLNDQKNAEFIELHNKGGVSVDLSGWKLDSGVNFIFPSGTNLAAGGYLIIAENKTYLQTLYPSATIVGNWTGKLGNNSDYIRLEDQYGNLADEVNYKVGGDWPNLNVNYGSSLELINPNMDNNRASAWRASRPPTGNFASYSTYGRFLDLWEVSDPIGNPRPGDTSQYKEIHIQSAVDAHIAVKNFQVIRVDANNNVQDATNIIGANATRGWNPGQYGSGWFGQGTHAETYYDGGANELHVISEGHGNALSNHVEVDATGLQANNYYRITFDAKWISGSPRLVVCSWDHSFGHAFYIEAPNAHGTPGVANSTAVLDAIPPQVDSIIHSPAVPKSNQTVTITARVQSSTNPTVHLYYRNDNKDGNGALNQVTMVDNGTAGDALSSDGIYSAQVVMAGDSNKKRYQFYVQASANGKTSYGPVRILPPTGGTNESVIRWGMWVVDDRTIPTDLRRQRIIVSAYDLESKRSSSGNYYPSNSAEGNSGSARAPLYKDYYLSNRYLPMTFIHNESDVYYLCEARGGGSMWHRPNGDLKMDYGGRYHFAGDRRFRQMSKGQYGAVWEKDNINDRFIGYFLYLLGYPAVYHEEHTYIMVNNVQWSQNINTDPNQGPIYVPAQDFDALPDVYVSIDRELVSDAIVERSFEDGEQGIVYETTENRRMNDTTMNTAQMQDWRFREGSSSVIYSIENPLRTRENDWDYSPLAAVFSAVTSPHPDAATRRKIYEKLIDINGVFRENAVRGACEDWDSVFAHGQNGNLYVLPDGRLTTLYWDGEASFRHDSAPGENPVLGSQNAKRPYFDALLNEPWIRRVVNYYLTEMYNNFDTPRTRAFIDAQKAISPAITMTFTVDGNTQSPDQFYFTTFWANHRKQMVLDTINQNVGSGGAGNAFNASFAVNTPGGSTSAATIDLTGTAPSSAFTIAIDNHPEAVVTWTNQTTWSATGVVLRNGSNNLTLRMVDLNGAQVGGSVNWSITKSSDALPIMDLDTDPSSGNVIIGQPVTFDASGTYDPDNQSLGNFTWSSSVISSIGSGAGFNIADRTTPIVTSPFTTPGLYRINVSAGGATTGRDMSVMNGKDFYSFTEKLLDSDWDLASANMGSRDSSPAGHWYSLYSKDGELMVHLSDTSLSGVSQNSPLSFASPTHPLLLRNISNIGTNNFALLSEVAPWPKNGNYFAGIYFEAVESGATVKYAFGLEGMNVIARRITSGGISDLGLPVPYHEGRIKLRVRRSGTNFRFDIRTTNSNDWQSAVFSQAIPAGTTAGKAGIFVSSAVVAPFNNIHTSEIAFDFFGVVDPTSLTDTVVSSLRITGLMYHPQAPDTVEYIELKNTGGSSINLNGVCLDAGSPVTGAVIGNVNLAAGATGVITNNSAAFIAKYGNSIPVLAQWTSGALSNEGERIVLRDAPAPQGNVIHDFTYDSASPWPTAPGGTGSALQVVSTSGDYNSPANWRATAASPGAGADTDGDGFSDAWEIKFASDPNNASSRFRATTSSNGSNQTVITWPSISSGGQQYRVEYCDTLGTTWQTLTTVSGVNGNTSFTDTTFPRPSKRFYRIIAL